MNKDWAGLLWKTLGFSLLAAAALPDSAAAAGLRLSPLRLDLSASQSSAQVELSNLGTVALPVQVKAFSWRQEDGRDIYEPTQDIFFAPPIVSVPANGKTIVRFRRRGPVAADMERAYRIYFQELPAAGQVQSSGASYRIRFGVPLFVAPVRAVSARLNATVTQEGARLKVSLANAGQAHLKIQGMELFANAADRKQPGAPLNQIMQSTAGNNYLLPGAAAAWEMDLPQDYDPAQHQILIRTNDYSMRAAKGLEPNGWLWLPLAQPAGG